MHSFYSVAIPAQIESQMNAHLIREDKQEDVLFALWKPSYGRNRATCLIHKPIFPLAGDRQRHGNASFNLQYFERVCRLALENSSGITFLHSHPIPGWQNMSLDDIAAEKKLMKAVYGITDLPLVGLTVSNDKIWSARYWKPNCKMEFERIWSESVRIVGKNLKVHFNNNLIAVPEYREEFRRTVTVWGLENHTNISRLKIGIVGLGSVGSFVAEMLARMGFSKIVLIDFDKIKKHNLDRTLFATAKDIGRLKIFVIKDMIKNSSTLQNIDVSTIPFSVAEKEGYDSALDCDVIFSCVDRPRARRILNHFAFAHLIPIIDGGIQVRFKNGIFSGADWQVQSVSPGKICLECLGAYSNSDVSTEIEGKLDDPSYIRGLPKNHLFKQNENVIPFSANLASLEIFHLIALVSGVANIDDFGTQRFRYVPGILDQDTNRQCFDECTQRKIIAMGDEEFNLFGTDHAANNINRNFIHPDYPGHIPLSLDPKADLGWQEDSRQASLDQ